MKKVFTLGVVALLFFSYNYCKKIKAYTHQQTCVGVIKEGDGDKSILDIVRTGTAEGYFEAAEAFGSWPSVRNMADGVFSELGPEDACFAERLYTKAAQLGSKPALDRLEKLYDCKFPFSYGTESKAGLSDVRKVRSGTLAADQLRTKINVNSYSAGAFRCGIFRALSTCQRPDIGSLEYKTKQEILCAGLI